MKSSRRLFFFLLVILSVLSACKDGTQPIEAQTRPDAEFRKYIAAYTSGVLARDGEISIVLQEPSAKFTVGGDEIAMDLLSVRPSLNGRLYWKNDRTIVFSPLEKMKSGTRYEFKFDLAQVLDVESRFSIFPFSIYTQAQGMKVKVLRLSPYNDSDFRKNRFKGIVVTADYLEEALVEEMIRFELDGEFLKSTWLHAPDGRKHTFFIDSILRQKDAQDIMISWSIDTDGFETDGNLTYDIPSISNFSYRDASIRKDPEQHIRIRFTDPLDIDQALIGLIRIGGSDDVRFEKESNVLKVYPKSRLTGAQTLSISSDVQNALGYSLGTPIEVEMDFTETKPLIRSVLSGSILPTTDGKIFPFEAVNLRSVDVEIKKVFENNIHQFLQVNEMGGDYQLSRVGRTVLKKKIDLSSNKALDYGVWNMFTLDLDELMSQEPGAIYQVLLSFRPSYSIYPCDVEVPEDGLDQGFRDGDDDYWDEYYYDDYYYDDYRYYRVPGYDWQERDNPCHISYYVNRTVKQNILSTDIGLIAKQGKDGKTYIAVNDIRTTQPIAGVYLELFDYQNQLIGSGKSAPDGTLVIEGKQPPFLLTAHRGKERAYLKMSDGNALFMSHFDVRGAEVQDGLKGYIYGERGVWRPGDTLFLNFILEDASRRLPKGHPVVMELTDPKGHVTIREVQNEGVDGIYDFTLKTMDDAPTGMWTAKVKVGAAEFYKRLPIEAVKPNRLKMELDFGEFIDESNGTANGTLTTTWLHGAVARNLKAEVSVILNASGVKPKGFEDYTFKDPVKSFDVEEQTIFEGRVNKEGKADIPLNLDLSSVAPGLVRAHFTTKVFEEGGGHSIDRFNIPYSPFEGYLGLRMPTQRRLEAGTKHSVPLVAVNKDGEELHMESVRVDVYRIDWRWWWDSGRDYLAQYVSDESRYRIQSFTLDSFTGRTEFELDVPEHEWSRYMVRVTDTNGGHSTGGMFYGYVPWRPGIANGEMPGGATMLNFELDKKKYSVGEKAKLSFPTGGAGRVLVSIEDGNEILTREWIDVDRELVEYSFDVTAEMAPNAYVHVTLLQPHERDNELPIRMYGVVGLLVESPETTLRPEINMPIKLSPESKVEVQISEKDGRAMSYTLAMVDEGLLDLTGFKTPDPHSAFYAREALGVKTWDRYDDVIGAFGSRIQSILSVGGDEEIDSEQEQKINRFKPMVRHIGPFHLKKGETATHEISIPNYVGSVRVMVVAAKEAAYGRAEKTVKVNKPLMVLATLPRVLGPNENVRLPVSVFAMEDDIKNVSIEIALTGPIEIVGDYERQIHFTQPDEQMLFFDLKTTSGLGKATAIVTARGAGHTSTYEIELPVRQSRLPESRSELLMLEAGEEAGLAYSHFAMPGTEELTLELSSMPSINLEGRLGYLTRYPHGCAEQTTSAAFPQLYLKSFLEEDDELAVKSTQNIVNVVSNLGKFQRSNGSFSTWPNRSYYNDWVTSYVGHFMIEARRMGYDVPVLIYDKWLKWQKGEVRAEFTSHRWYSREYYEKARAYRLFTLALAGSPDMASMNRLKNSRLLDKPSIYMLAAAYHMAGQKDVASKMVAEHPHFTPKNRRDGYSYASVNRDKAIILECLVIMEMKKQALPLVLQLAEALSSNKYMNTQATAFSLRAMLSLDILEKKDMDFVAFLDGKEVASGRTQLTFKQYDLTELSGRSGQMSIVNKSQGLLYARVVQTGIPSRDTQKAEQSNINMVVRYLDMEGNDMSIDQLEQGTEFYIDLVVANPNTEDPLEDLALTMVLPSGWEPNIDRMDAPVGEEATDEADYMDIRDDRVMLYFNLDRNDELERYQYRKYMRHFRFTVNASYSGSYYMPGIQVESMYDPEVYDRKRGKMVSVYRPGF